MYKKIIIMTLAMAFAIGLQAKDDKDVVMRTVTGIVIDDKGAPVPGALIESPDKDFSTTTDIDGTFTLEVSPKTKSLRATYPGLPSKSEKLKKRKEPTEHVAFTLQKAKGNALMFVSPVGGWALQKYKENRRNKEMREAGNAATTRTIAGVVIDKDKVPIADATVEATGGAETVTTDENGAFTMEIPFWLKAITVSYPGMKSKKVDLDYKKQDENVLLIKMGKRKKIKN